MDLRHTQIYLIYFFITLYEQTATSSFPISGNVSFRSTLMGSWFIQELCKNITAYGKRDDVFSIITRTMKCVSGNYYHYEGGIIKKQMPVCMSTLSKKFYLNLNKDRSLILMSKSNYEELYNQVKQVNERLDALLAWG